MDIKTHIETAWNHTLSHIVPLLIITLVLVAVSVISLGILAPVAMAGYMHALLLLVREGREPSASDIFSQMHLFFPLLIFGILVLIITLIGFLLLVLPGFIFALLASFFSLYMIPIMTDRKFGLIDAFKKSFFTVTRENTVDHIVVFVVFWGITALGSSFMITALFCQPLATLFLVSVYDEVIRT
ncbi:MAG: hypothetical protein D3926_09725 [Desulfobacteraceae bacterium]|nr:MAG: hypothetical protein D3926_09725 [Desulfobacteraceae bacterium]